MLAGARTFPAGGIQAHAALGWEQNVYCRGHRRRPARAARPQLEGAGGVDEGLAKHRVHVTVVAPLLQVHRSCFSSTEPSRDLMDVCLIFSGMLEMVRPYSRVIPREDVGQDVPVQLEGDLPNGARPSRHW